MLVAEDLEEEIIRMAEYTGGQTTQAIEDVLKAKSIHTYLLIGQGKDDEIFAVAKEGEEYLVTLLAEFILTDKRIEEIFLTALQLAVTKKDENN
jgi:hypothetical protein